MKMPPSSFWHLTIHEANLALEGYKKEQQEQYSLSLCCLQNALGMAFGGDKFKPINPFESAKSKKEAHKVSKKQREENLAYINNLFEKFGGGENSN
nr:MAG TPA: hypothetical protein [Caudoviricetes sp.]